MQARAARAAARSMARIVVDLLTSKLAYMRKIDERQAPKIIAYKYVALKACMENRIDLAMSNGKEVKACKSFHNLRKLMNTYVYNTAKLQPRRSDTDFMPGERLDGVTSNLVQALQPENTAERAKDREFGFMRSWGDMMTSVRPCSCSSRRLILALRFPS